MAHRIPLVAAILPLLAMIYLSGYSNPVLLSGVALSYIASILCLRLSRMFRSIYEANDKFRLIFSVLYAFLTILFPAMYILTSSYALAQFVLTLIFGMALVGFILYTMKIYSPEQLSDIGWKNLDQEHMGTIPTEGSIGDKLAIVLTVLIVLTIVFVVVAA